MKFRVRILASIALAFVLIAPGPALAKKSLELVVTAAFVSYAGLDVYDSMAEYLSKKTGYDVSVVYGLTYAEADAALERGDIEIGAICGMPYVQKEGKGIVELLAVPVMATGQDRWKDVPGYANVPGKYYSYTIVHKDSPIKSWKDLRGKTYAFNDMESNSGYNMPRAKLIDLGAKSWEGYFSRVVVSGTHEESIRLVAEGLVDASSVDSLVLDFDRSIDDPYANDVRVIEVLFEGGAGAPPFVVNGDMDEDLKSALQTALVGMDEDERGREILAEALLARFDMPDDANYDDIRSWMAKAERAGFVDFGAGMTN